MTRWRDGETQYEAVVRTGRTGLEVVVNGEVHGPRVAALGAGAFVLEDGPRRLRFWCVRSGDGLHVSWEGHAYVLRAEREGARHSASDAGAGLSAPMPGKVIKLNVRVGDTVTKGAELLVVESMKMENALRAPKGGRVKSLRCALGDMVAPGAPLVELE